MDVMNYMSVVKVFRDEFIKHTWRSARRVEYKFVKNNAMGSIKFVKNNAAG